VIVDSSAVLAILFNEPDAQRFARALAGASRCQMSAANYLEAAIVLESRRTITVGFELDLVLERTPIDLVPVTVAQAEAARRAWRRFGKGNHPAGLNFGDCFAYALAESTGEPLLFKGRDFALTDVDAA
jgi:ribonuclease VapC